MSTTQRAGGWAGRSVVINYADLTQGQNITHRRRLQFKSILKKQETLRFSSHFSVDINCWERLRERSYYKLIFPMNRVSFHPDPFNSPSGSGIKLLVSCPGNWLHEISGSWSQRLPQPSKLSTQGLDLPRPSTGIYWALATSQASSRALGAQPCLTKSQSHETSYHLTEIEKEHGISLRDTVVIATKKFQGKQINNLRKTVAVRVLRLSVLIQRWYHSSLLRMSQNTAVQWMSGNFRK